MNLNPLEEKPPVADFNYDGPGGPISAKALGEFARHLPNASVKSYLRRFEGYVLRCESVQVTNDLNSATVHLTGLTAVLGGDLIDERDLSCVITPEQSHVFLVASTAIEPLDPEVYGGLQARVVRGSLSPYPGGASQVIRVASVRWARVDGDPDGPMVAAVERYCWPPVLRIADHPSSLATASELQAMSHGLSAPAAYLLAAALRGEEVGWPAVLPEMLSAVGDRFRDRPERLFELAQLAVESSGADLVAGLVRLLRTDMAGNLSTMIPIDGHQARLAVVLRDARPSEHIGETGSTVTLDCGVAPVAGWLAVAVTAPPGTVYHVTATVNGVEHVAIRSAGRGAESVVQVAAGASVKLSVSSDGRAPSVIGVGIYTI